jgi:hypothetical protein
MLKKAIYDGEWMDKKYYNRDKAIKWFESVGEKNIERGLELIKRNGPPAGAPPRADMPKIEPQQVSKVGKELSAGKIDVREPYNESTNMEGYINKTNNMKFSYFDNFVNESKTDKPDWHKMKDGDEIYIYINNAKDGSGASMGNGIAGNLKYVTKCIFRGIVGNSELAFQADFENGNHVGLPISDNDVVPYSVLKKIKIK